ncbi:brevican core protein-like isoform X2 [Acropora muricata]|uniref:brevican core protein-like isoform X2 n=1 Tax=Acropora muricata TaxID=159855 RepID=UPI0034E517ED
MEMFEFLVNFKRLLLLILLSLAHADKETSADETTVAVSRKGITQKFEFVNFKQDKFSFLNITALAKRVVKDSLSCVFSCLDNLACFSFNLAAFPDEAGKFVCEILSSDKYNNSENFLPSKALHHFGIVSPCSKLPCKNSGKCVTLYETNSYVCVCNNGFTGKHCEVDTCPAGFLIHGKSCYYVANTSSASTWNKSRIFCQNLGADLAVIKSEEENKFVSDLLRNTSGQNGWIGLHRKADKKLYWLDNRPIEKNFQKWKMGEPKNIGGKEDCGLLIGRNSRSKGQWADRECSDTDFVAICQWPI